MEQTEVKQTEVKQTAGRGSGRKDGRKEGGSKQKNEDPQYGGEKATPMEGFTKKLRRII